MNGQGNIEETRLAELTQEILFLDKLKKGYPVWSLSRHQIEAVLEGLNRERSNILEKKKAQVII